jgi:hypothetical protein
MVQARNVTAAQWPRFEQRLLDSFTRKMNVENPLHPDIVRAARADLTRTYDKVRAASAANFSLYNQAWLTQLHDAFERGMGRRIHAHDMETISGFKSPGRPRH